MPEALPLLAVPNVSEGSDGELIDRLGAAFGRRARLLDVHSDAVHARSVFTLAAQPDALAESLLDGARLALELLDVRRHAGAHPRIGVLDVCPVVYVERGSQGRARELALASAEAFAELGLPVFLYGELAAEPQRHERHHFRRGGLEALATRMAEGELLSDLGPSGPHRSGGAVLVTARPPLAAFNVELVGVDFERARAIAAALREGGGGPAGVRAIAIDLGAGVMQISTNVHDPLAVPLGEIVARVREGAAAAGGAVAAAEVVGLVARDALHGFPAEVEIRGGDPALQTIEAHLGVDDDGPPEPRAG